MGRYSIGSLALANLNPKLERVQALQTQIPILCPLCSRRRGSGKKDEGTEGRGSQKYVQLCRVGIRALFYRRSSWPESQERSETHGVPPEFGQVPLALALHVLGAGVGALFRCGTAVPQDCMVHSIAITASVGRPATGVRPLHDKRVVEAWQKS